ncbi:MAG: hypothetical protein AVDCRST_MAG49-853 [uncultured Thermomicrobiales bacterium]|uniref:Alkaline shock protein 23 n=1 Tax=uncultured Thermomicrobiales bacterium TaxID=1645740 RepID=A0A6J4U4Y8_9BACT|nr:MAG: hypothetical protein AVDCRST_MAG49-853 [uncultured Thermomicrobiales bacterium]
MSGERARDGSPLGHDRQEDEASGGATDVTEGSEPIAIPRGAPVVEPRSGGVRGTVRVAPAVLIELIELTVRDVSGVVGFQPRRRVERILPRYGHTSERRGEPGTGTYEEGGVRVRLAGDQIDVDVSIVIQPDANIVELSRAIRREVGAAAGRMLGMTVTDVNVYVASIEPAPDPAGH